MPDLDVDELVRLRRTSPQFVVHDPILGDAIAVPLLAMGGEDPEDEGPREPADGSGPAATDDELRQYVSLKESLRAINDQLRKLEPRVHARAARNPAGGLLYASHGRELHARPRMFPVWHDPKSRDDMLHELDVWDQSSAYSYARFGKLYHAEAGLRDFLADAVTEELRFTMTIRKAVR